RSYWWRERGGLAERWRSERWDSLCFQFPNWSLTLPGQPYDGGDPEGFATRDDVVAFIERSAAAIAAPLRTGVTVLALGTGRDGFRLETSHGALEAESVGVATGTYQEPVIPALGAALPARIVQVHSSAYRNPGRLPPGAVLVVGSGASGCQVVEGLLRAGRRRLRAQCPQAPSPARSAACSAGPPPAPPPPAAIAAVTCSGGWSGWARSIRPS